MNFLELHPPHLTSSFWLACQPEVRECVTPPILSNDSGRLMGYYVEDHSHIYRKRLQEAFLVLIYHSKSNILQTEFFVSHTCQACMFIY